MICTRWKWKMVWNLTTGYRLAILTIPGILRICIELHQDFFFFISKSIKHLSTNKKRLVFLWHQQHKMMKVCHIASKTVDTFFITSATCWARKSAFIFNKKCICFIKIYLPSMCWWCFFPISEHSFDVLTCLRLFPFSMAKSLKPIRFSSFLLFSSFSHKFQFKSL